MRTTIGSTVQLFQVVNPFLAVGMLSEKLRRIILSVNTLVNKVFIDKVLCDKSVSSRIGKPLRSIFFTLKL